MLCLGYSFCGVYVFRSCQSRLEKADKLRAQNFYFGQDFVKVTHVAHIILLKHLISN